VEQAGTVIVTLTPNSGLDRVIFLPRFEWGETIRAADSLLAMGGKGTDVSMVLAELGDPGLALGFAAGQTGERMVRMLEKQAVRCDFVWAEGETRTNDVLIDTDKDQQSTITLPGLVVRPEHIRALRSRLRRHLPQASCLVLGGSLPQGMGPEVFHDLISDAKAAGVPTLFDASGPGLRAGARALPTLLKLNRTEMEQLSGHRLSSSEGIRCAAREWVARGVERVVVTAGTQGVWAFGADEAYFIPALRLKPVNTAGAGDGPMAGLAMGLVEKRTWAQALRLGVAVAAAVCLTPGTAQCHQEDVERLLPEVQIIPLQEQA
jgi:1-phosphofructokinase